MTGQWEAYLKRIERGAAQLEPFLAGIEEYVRQVVGKVGKTPITAAVTCDCSGYCRAGDAWRVNARASDSRRRMNLSPICCIERLASPPSAPIRRKSARLPWKGRMCCW